MVPDDFSTSTRHRAAKQIDEDLRRDHPRVWWVVAVLAAVWNPWTTVRLVWLRGLDWWKDVQMHRRWH